MERRERRQVDEVYTIKQVAEMTGVPDNTIRSWERRFGIPNPGRSGSNQRRYDNSDIEAIRTIQAARDRGRTMEQAIAALQAPETAPEHLPISPILSPAPGPVSPLPYVKGWDGSQLYSALLKLDASRAESILADAIVAITIDQACFSVLMEADERLVLAGVDSSEESGTVRFAREWIARKLSSIFDVSNPESGRTHVAIAAMHDDSARTLALCMAIVISRAGYRVSWAGSSLAADVALSLVGRLQPSAFILVANSALSQRAAASFASLLSASSKPNLAILSVGVDEIDVPGMMRIEPAANSAVRELDAALETIRSKGIHVMRKQ